MQVGIFAKKIGLSVDAIRFYERNGLLPRPPRTQGGFPDIETPTSKPLPLFIVCRGWDSHSARFEAC